MQAQVRLLLLAAHHGVEGIRPVEAVVTEVLEERAVECVRAGLRHHRHLPARARPVLRGIVVRVDAELLHVLQARLQAEGRRDLAVEVAGRGVDDGGAFHSVVADDVLLDGTAAEADVAEGAGAAVQRARRLQVELRELAAVDGQSGNLALVHVGAHAGVADVEQRSLPGDRHRLALRGRSQRDVEPHFLTGQELDVLELDGRESEQGCDDRVGGRIEGREHVPALRVRRSVRALARAQVLGRDRCSREDEAAGVAGRARDAARARGPRLREHRALECERQQHRPQRERRQGAEASVRTASITKVRPPHSCPPEVPATLTPAIDGRVPVA